MQPDGEGRSQERRNDARQNDARRNDDRFLDELLDASLARYSRAEARPGLEERVLRGVRERQQKAPRAGWMWEWRWPALAAAAAIAIVAGVVMTREPQPPARVASNPPARPTASPAPPGANTGERAAAPPRVAVTRHQPQRVRAPQIQVARAAQTVAALPKLAQFPAAAPPSGEEVLLARLAAEADPAHMAALAAVANAGIRPLEEDIKPLQTAPLDPRIDTSAPTRDAPGPSSPQQQ